MKWYESNPIRFEIEKRLLARYHHGSRIIIEKGKMKVQKRFHGSKEVYLVEGIFSDRHPYSPMNFYIKEPRLKNSPPHKFSDGWLCLHGSDDVGPETTAKVYMDWAIQWLQTYERWLDGEEWPDTNKG
jgi:hypothetical protein